jgi:hypothetical protein
MSVKAHVTAMTNKHCAQFVTRDLAAVETTARLSGNHYTSLAKRMLKISTDYNKLVYSDASVSRAHT